MMFPHSTSAKKHDLTPVEQDGQTYLVSPSDIDFFLKTVGRRTQFQIDFTGEFDEQRFALSPFIGYVHSYDGSRQLLNFKYAGSDINFYEHIVCAVSDIRRILFLEDPRSDEWRNKESLI